MGPVTHNFYVRAVIFFIACCPCYAQAATYLAGKCAPSPRNASGPLVIAMLQVVVDGAQGLSRGAWPPIESVASRCLLLRVRSRVLPHVDRCDLRQGRVQR